MGFLGTCITSYVHTDMLIVKKRSIDTTLGRSDGGESATSVVAVL